MLVVFIGGGLFILNTFQALRPPNTHCYYYKNKHLYDKIYYRELF